MDNFDRCTYDGRTNVGYYTKTLAEVGTKRHAKGYYLRTENALVQFVSIFAARHFEKNDL